MNELDLNYLLSGTPVRMRYVNRWSTSRVSFPENVAEHSYFVCLYAMMVAKWYCWNKKVSFAIQCGILSETLQKAVLHDIEESRTGDIHRPFKYSSSELYKAMKFSAEIAAKQTLEPISFQEEIRGDIWRIWKDSKDDSKTGLIVRFADFLAVLEFLKQEGGDTVRTLCLDTLPDHYAEFNDRKFDFIRPLVVQIMPIVQEILGGEKIKCIPNESEQGEDVREPEGEPREHRIDVDRNPSATLRD